MTREHRGNDPPVILRPARREDKEGVLLMRERATGEKQDPDLWDWLFVRNTSSSRLHCYVAQSGDSIVAQNATLPVRLTHAGMDLPGLADLHAATDPAFRGRGLFAALGERLQADVASERPLVYAFPNPASRRIFYEELGWEELRPFPVYLRPLGNIRPLVAERSPRLFPVARAVDKLAPLGLLPARATRRVADRKGARVTRLDRFGPWADKLWQELRPLLGTCAVRDADFLGWRFFESPFRYTVYGLDRGTGPVGFAVVSIRPGKLADLMELMVPPDDRFGAQLLLAHAVSHAASSRAMGLRAIISRRHPHRTAFLKAGFMPMPRRLKTDYSFGVCILDPSHVNPSVIQMDDWYISGADLDYR